MKNNRLSWILLLLPVVIALPQNVSIEATESFETGFLPLVEPKLITLGGLLQAFKIKDFESLSFCRLKNAYCPLEKQELLNYIRRISQRKCAPFVSNKKDFGSAFLVQVAPLPSTEPEFETTKSNLRNNIAMGSMIYLLYWTYGASLNRNETQEFNELYRIANETFMKDFNTLYDDTRKQLAESLYERTLLNARFDLIVKDIELNSTKQESQLNLIVTEIERENYLIAMTLFLELDDVELLPTIVERTMDNAKLSHFLATLPKQQDRVFGYSMVLRKPNLGYNIFTINHDFNTIFTSEEPTERLRKFSLLLKDQADDTMKSMTQLILDKKDPENYVKLIEYSSNDVEPFNGHLEELLKNLFKFRVVVDDDEDNDDQHHDDVSDDDYYDPHYLQSRIDAKKIRAATVKEQKLKAILAFAGDLTEITQSARVYLELFKLMQKDGNYLNFQFLLQIASKVKELTLMKNYWNTPLQVIGELKEFEDKLEPIVKFIVWGHGHVCIKNYNTGGYLHKNNRCDSDRGNVILTEDRDLWAVESSGKNNLFAIRHVETNEILYSTTESLIFTARKDESGLVNQYWNLEMFGIVSEFGDKSFYMKNEGLNMFMSYQKKPDGFVICTDAITTEDPQLERLSEDRKLNNDEIGHDNKKAWIFIDSARC